MWYLGSIESKSDSQGTIAEATHSLVARRGGRQSLKGGAWWWFSVGGSQVAAPGLESIGWLYGKTMFHLTPLGVPGSGPKRKYRRVSASVAIRDKKQCETGVMIQLITSIDAIAPVPVQPTGITSFSSCKRKKELNPRQGMWSDVYQASLHQHQCQQGQITATNMIYEAIAGL